MRTEAESGVMKPQAKEREEPPEAGKGEKGIFSGALGPVDTLILDFEPPEL